MARIAFLTRVIDEAGNALGGSPTEVRLWDDFGATVAATVTDDAAGGTTIAQPMTPNAGTQTTLAVTTGTGDTTLTVASTAGFAVGQLIPIYDGTNTRYRFIRSILAGPPRLTIDSAIGVVFSNTNTAVGNPDMLGVIAGYVADTSFHYIQTKDVASTRVMPPTLIPTFIASVSSIAVLEEGGAVGNRPTLNFIGPLVTATDNAPSTRVDITVATPTAPGASAVGDTQATGTTSTVAAADHRHAREAFAALVAFAYAAANGSATTLPRSDHNHGLALTTAQAALSGDVAMATAGTWYDGPSVSLAAGTWIVIATVDVQSGDPVANNPCAIFARLWDGTTTWESGEQYMFRGGVAGNKMGTITLKAVITLGSTTTVKASCTSSHNTGNIKAALSANGVGNNASQITAVRVA